jgi:hypothetical protein
MDSHAWLVGIPASRPNAERMQHDVDIGYGYMHAGYPVTGRSFAACMVLLVAGCCIPPGILLGLCQAACVAQQLHPTCWHRPLSLHC